MLPLTPSHFPLKDPRRAESVSVGTRREGGLEVAIDRDLPSGIVTGRHGDDRLPARP
jgi:hypothetical protein